MTKFVKLCVLRPFSGACRVWVHHAVKRYLHRMAQLSITNRDPASCCSTPQEGMGKSRPHHFEIVISPVFVRGHYESLQQQPEGGRVCDRIGVFNHSSPLIRFLLSKTNKSK